MKKVLNLSVGIAVIATALVIGSVSCGGTPASTSTTVEKTGRAVRYTHNPAIGEAIVVVKGGSVISITLDEYFGPVWAGNLGNAQTTDAKDVETILIGDNLWAKRIKIGDEIFTATISDGSSLPAYVGSFKGNAISDLQAAIGTGSGTLINWPEAPYTEELWTWYVDNCKAKKVVFLTADGREASLKVGVFGSDETLSKNSSWYWGADGSAPPQLRANQQGLKRNFEAIIAFAKTHLPFANPISSYDNNEFTMELDGPRMTTNHAGEPIEDDNGGPQWRLGADIVSGATATDTPNYLKVILLAYNNAIKN